jgi:hypothetical protein
MEICRQWQKLGPSKEKLSSHPNTLFWKQKNTGSRHNYSGVAIFHLLCGLQLRPVLPDPGLPSLLLKEKNHGRLGTFRGHYILYSLLSLLLLDFLPVLGCNLQVFDCMAFYKKLKR